MMGDFLEVLLFVVPITTVVGGTIYLVRSKFSRLQQELAEERGANQMARLAGEKSELEERVRVLERVVTGRGYSLAEEIEALRDAASEDGSGRPLDFGSKEKA